MIYVVVFVFVGVVVAGTIVAYLVPSLTYDRISLLILFTAGYIFSTTVVHLLPEMFRVASTDGEHMPFLGDYVSLVLLMGFLLQHFLSQLTMGVEHGHSHKIKGNEVPFKTAVALCLHAFLEGLISLHSSALHEILTLNALLFGVLLHKFPAAIAFTFVLRSYYGPRSKYVLLWATGFAFSTPLAIFSVYLSSIYTTKFGWITILMLPLLGGMFLHLAMAMFFEVAPRHIYGLRKNVVLILGVVLAIFMEYVMHFLPL